MAVALVVMTVRVLVVVAEFVRIGLLVLLLIVVVPLLLVAPVFVSIPLPAFFAIPPPAACEGVPGPLSLVVVLYSLPIDLIGQEFFDHSLV